MTPQETIKAPACAKCGVRRFGGVTIGSNATASDLGVNVGDYVCPKCHDCPEELEPMLRVEYRCPDCGTEWEEYYTAACDSECPQCHAENVTALKWEEIA